MSDREDAPPELSRLRPEAVVPAALARAGGDRGPDEPAAPFDPRRYRWSIGIVGLVVVVGFSVYLFFAHPGPGSTGVAPGHRLRFFAAPLAASDLQGDPNLNPPCTRARHDPRALNLCLDARAAPVVVSFFVLGSAECERQVDALQELAPRFAGVRFLAVAIHASHAATRRAVRAHRWTIPVAYDRDGSVGSQYAVAACPMSELAARGGIVRARLIGERWATATALTPRVRALAAGG